MNVDERGRASGREERRAGMKRCRVGHRALFSVFSNGSFLVLLLTKGGFKL